MFFDNEFHSLFTLFAFILLKLIICDVDTISTAPNDVDLKRFNRTFHCKFQPNGHICNIRKKSLKYYFDVQLKRCVRFYYGNCNHSYNMFDTRRLCLDACREDAYAPVQEISSPFVYCRYQPHFGDCNAYHPSWYFDNTLQRCKGFSYSGCGGNLNRFSDAMQCAMVCGTALAS